MSDPDPLPMVLERLARLPAAEAADRARADQDARWRAGQSPPAEAYLAGLPAVAADPEQALVLIYGEVLARAARGERPTLPEYRGRFPHLADRLAVQFDLHAALAASQSTTGAYRPSTPAEVAERFAPGTLLAGRYRVVAPLGKGGMGEVYRADDLTLGQPIALKFLPVHLSADPDRLARFRKEVAAARRVGHPNVCRVYDIADHDGQSFLTMEYVDGEDLGSVLTRLGRVPEEKGVEVARQLCSALAAVHEQGLLHRDLKPANVMLDGRGKVRLTDFGLAAAAEDMSATEVRSGTPLYQAPEQRSGREVTARSDLFALGLVLYELFTGRRAYPGASRDTPPSKPSSHVTGLDPVVERVILKCLEADPAARPRSAHEVLAGLPGGDPLAAAVAAGETPSPQLVAAAPVEGTLRPAVALAMLTGVVAGLLVIAGLNDRLRAHRHVPLPPPAVLEEKARALVRDLGYTDPPADAVGGFEMPDEHMFYMARNNAQPAATREQMPLCRPALAVYWYRQSPLPLVPVHHTDDGAVRVVVSSWNPPSQIPGMVKVKIDTRGRLVEFLAVPDTGATAPPVPVGWDAVLKAAGLDAPGVLRPDPAATPTPPVFADRTAAWDGVYPDRLDLAIQVEAAEYRGRPVYFRITHPDWGVPPRDRPNPIVDRGAAFYAALRIISGVITFGVVVVAVRNVLRGRADLRGAVILAVAVAVFLMLFWLLAAGHFPGAAQFHMQFVNALVGALYPAGIAAAGYLALEPMIRRRCPHRLTAWTRLTAGRWRDPLVGRDVLIGVLVGVAVSFDYPAMLFWPSAQGPTVVHPISFTRPAGELAVLAAGSLTLTWLFAGLFAVVLAIGRREWVAAGVVGGYVAAIFILASGYPLLNQVGSAVRVAAAVCLFLRFGQVAFIAFYFAVSVTQDTPLSLDPSAWYFGASLTYLLAAVGLAVYAAYTATAGRLLGTGDAAGD